MAEYCNDGRFAIRRTYWENQNQYDSVANKFAGIGHDTVEHFKTGFSQYGMKSAITGAGNIDALLAQPNAFSPNNIMISLGNVGWADDVDTAISKGVTQFYIDEPI